jgi:hypothetical protein
MARIELRDCTIRIKDGLSGTALITEGAVAMAVLNSNAVNSDLTFTALDEGVEWNSWNFTSVADVNAGANADATLPINAANGDLIFTSPAKDDVYNGCIFEANSNGAEAILYDVNTDTFTLEFNTAVSNGSAMKTAFDAALVANPTWPQWSCAIEGDGSGVWLLADDDTANVAAANGVDVVAAGVTFSPNTFTIHTTGANIASDVVTMWGVGPAQCADWSIADEGAGDGIVDDTTVASAGGLAEPANTDTDVNISTVVLNTTYTDLVPVGARFTPSTAGHTTIHTVTARTPVSTSPTTNIVFTPAWGLTNVPEKGDTLNFLPQQIEIKVGEGNLTFTESKEYEYLLDRGILDAVKEGDEQPLEVELEFVYEHITTGTSEAITPVDALKNKGNASEWVSTSDDLCEPYCVDIEVQHDVPCGTSQDETTILPEFRYDDLEFNLQDATISVSGKCNATEATVTRS